MLADRSTRLVTSQPQSLPGFALMHGLGFSSASRIAKGVLLAAYLTLGGELRFRSESTWNPNWGETRIDKYEWYRILPYADLHLGPNVRMFGQIIGAWAGEKTNLVGVDETGFDIQQAFADLRLPV